MNKKDVKKMVKEMKAWTKKVTADPETAKKTLMAIGIIDNKGELTENYR